LTAASRSPNIASMGGSYESLLERLQSYATRGGLDDARLAREEFHRRTGEFVEGEPWYELRMNMFLDYYLLDRPSSAGATPAEAFLLEHGDALDRAERLQFKHLTVTLRTAFRLRRIRGAQLDLDDLGGGGRWRASWTLPSIGLAVGDIVDTRVVLIDGVPTVGRSAVLHPREAHEAIEKIVARARGAGMPPRDLVDHLDKMRLKLDRYSNVRIRHVYQYPDDAIM
jgi:hypothetical protein